MARPKLSPAEKKSPTLSIRLSEKDFLLLEALRNDVGSQKSTFYRDLLLNQAKKIEVKPGKSSAVRVLLPAMHKIQMDCEAVSDLVHRAFLEKKIDDAKYKEIVDRLDFILQQINSGVDA